MLLTTNVHATLFLLSVLAASAVIGTPTYRSDGDQRRSLSPNRPPPLISSLKRGYRSSSGGSSSSSGDEYSSDSDRSSSSSDSEQSRHSDRNRRFSVPSPSQSSYSECTHQSLHILVQAAAPGHGLSSDQTNQRIIPGAEKALEEWKIQTRRLIYHLKHKSKFMSALEGFDSINTNIINNLETTDIAKLKGNVRLTTDILLSIPEEHRHLIEQLRPKTTSDHLLRAHLPKGSVATVKSVKSWIQERHKSELPREFTHLLIKASFYQLSLVDQAILQAWITWQVALVADSFLRLHQDLLLQGDHRHTQSSQGFTDVQGAMHTLDRIAQVEGLSDRFSELKQAWTSMNGSRYSQIYSNVRPSSGFHPDLITDRQIENLRDLAKNLSRHAIHLGHDLAETLSIIRLAHEVFQKHFST
ncbi:hypothetical protein BJ684DRAFT_19941 [Piptocephalis cylindrospora]|uniref:Uncharacterized protein n=1 Tax=Piptocephalis cylindrospora TaxID=1907219 RepID=A0A4P9Y413_9FUNG|nr:hypothetical protein BJ684DRAFT_19941 [Piptocephalis cylindrospora]|eukprot:RKP13573.1 hypothetical protein BJ684DRAFT_19941 [Piptocephalis cylindrospora]